MSSSRGRVPALSVSCAQVIGMRNSFKIMASTTTEIPLYSDSQSSHSPSHTTIRVQSHIIRGIMPTKIELTLEQSQQGVSNDVLVSIEGVEE
ncbi:hypothetical protein Tco_0951554 [Tanacetum coccineum]|uniref:Uncharacterized protein n=1 Tax=Tanacetum coccineum TaxID=301880 RepID=A0ABQ5E0H6_9ASTR